MSPGLRTRKPRNKVANAATTRNGFPLFHSELL